MEYKPGDKIILISDKDESNYYKKYIGKVFTVKYTCGNYVTVKETDEINPFVSNIVKLNRIQNFNFRKAPIGTKITFKNGDTIIKNDKKTYSNAYFTTYDNQIYKEIIAKIEEPEYRTVYVNIFDVLDEKERKYLKDVIRPFRNRVKHITKRNIFEGQEVITICIDSYYAVNLPLFEKGTMYIGMETDKNYTLEDLDI